MKKRTLVIIAVIMVLALVALVFLVGLFVVPEQKNPNLSEYQASQIHSILWEITRYLEYPENAAGSVPLQQCLTALHVKCENMAALADFYYPADTSFRHLADGIAQGAYSPEELRQMHVDFVRLRNKFLTEDSTDEYIEERVMPYWELSKLLTDLLKYWVRSDP